MVAKDLGRKTQLTKEKTGGNTENISDSDVLNAHAEDCLTNGKKRFRCRLAVIIVVVIIVIAPRTCSGDIEITKPVNELKVVYENIHKLWEITELHLKHMSCVKPSLQDTQQYSCCVADPANLVERMEFDNRIRNPEKDMSNLLNTNYYELFFLKSVVQKLTDEVAQMRKEHRECQKNVKTLQKTLRKHSRAMNRTNTRVSEQMHLQGRSLLVLNGSVGILNSTVSSLNLSVERLGSNLNFGITLNYSVENRITTAVSDISGQINAQQNDLGVLKDELRTLNASLEARVKTVEMKFGEHSNLTDMKHVEVLKRISDQTEFANELNVSLKNISSSFDGLYFHVKNIGNTLTSQNVSVENRVDAIERDLSGEINTNRKETEAVKNEVQQLDTKLGAMLKTLEDKVGEQSHFEETRNAQVMNQISQHNETLNGLNANVENIGSTLSGLNATVESLGCNVSILNASLNIFNSHMKHLAENMSGISIDTVVLDKRTEVIEENIFDKVSLTLVIMINTSLLVVVIIYLVANRKNATMHSSGDICGDQAQIKLNPTLNSTAGRILSKVPYCTHLIRKLCVVSFYEETHPMHMEITQSVTLELDVKVLELTIRKHEEILELPKVSLYYLFVDFNERNVILEDPTLGLGDLRLTTVQAIQKMGGRLIVFYVRDPHSRQLKQWQLYNERLSSVTKQQELSHLNKMFRFISAYDQLTDYQKGHLRRIVVQELNVRN